MIIFALLLLVHLHDRPDLNGWAHDLRSGAGIPCCDNSEATPLKDPDWKTNDEGHYIVFIDNEWILVPDSAIVVVPNRYGPALVWYVHNPGFGIYVRCFLPGAGA